MLDKNADLAVAVSLEHARNNKLIPMSEIYCFENGEQIWKYPTKILVRNDFPLLNELNAFINQAISNGLMEKWLTKTWSRPDYLQEDDDNGQITIANFSGFFVLWICLSIVPTAVCLIEKTIARFANKSNPSRISLLLEMLIDGERHFLLQNIRLNGRQSGPLF